MTTKRTKTRLDFSYQYEEEEIVREGAKRERPKIRISLRPDKRFGYLPTNLSPVERFERVISKKRLVKTPIIQESKSFVETSSKNKITGFNEFAKQSKRKDLFKHPQMRCPDPNENRFLSKSQDKRKPRMFISKLPRFPNKLVNQSPQPNRELSGIIDTPVKSKSLVNYSQDRVNRFAHSDMKSQLHRLRLQEDPRQLKLTKIQVKNNKAFRIPKAGRDLSNKLPLYMDNKGLRDYATQGRPTEDRTPVKKFSRLKFPSARKVNTCLTESMNKMSNNYEDVQSTLKRYIED